MGAPPSLATRRSLLDAVHGAEERAELALDVIVAERLGLEEHPAATGTRSSWPLG
jgi:hypothetical protein